MSPNVKFGKIDNSTELIVNPFKRETQEGSSVLKQNSAILKEEPNKNSLYQRLFNKGINQLQISSNTKDVEVIDSRTLDNVTDQSSVIEDSSESTRNSETINIEESSTFRKSKQKFMSQTRLFQTLWTEINSQDRKFFNFRAIPRVWGNSQMCDVYVSNPFQHESQTIFALNYDTINENDERVSREYYVALKIDPEIDKNSKQAYATIELNDILMAKLKISQFSRITLSSKNTIVNFLEKIELIPSSSNLVDMQEIIEDFKRTLVKSSSTSPLLINQDQIFKLCGGTVLVTAKLFPESFRYCFCDAEILRERKIFLSNQFKDLKTIMKAADEISSLSNVLTAHERYSSFIHTNELISIIEECTKCITIKNCLNEKNRLRKLGNILILGKFLYIILMKISLVI